MRDLNAALDTEVAKPPESWRPKPGDKLVGRLVRYHKATGRFGPCWTAVLEREPDGAPLAVWLQHAVLVDRFKSLQPKVGERVAIKRLPDASKGYACYAVIVDRPDEAPEWGTLAATEGQP